MFHPSKWIDIEEKKEKKFICFFHNLWSVRRKKKQMIEHLKTNKIIFRKWFYRSIISINKKIFLIKIVFFLPLLFFPLPELLNLNIVEFKSWKILNWFEWYNVSHLFHGLDIRIATLKCCWLFFIRRLSPSSTCRIE